MITFKDWMNLVDYKVTSGCKYEWQCYGDNAYSYDFWNERHGNGGYNFSIIFDTKTRVVYEVSVCDYGRHLAYRIINPEYKQAYKDEATTRSLSDRQAWDDVDFTDLETDEDFLTKGQAILAGLDYDTRVNITLDFSDEELLKYMKLAHERDITFNQFIELAVKTMMDARDIESKEPKSE